MRKQERVNGTGCEPVYGSDRRSGWSWFDHFDHLDAPLFMPAGACLKLDLDGERSVVAIKSVMRGGI